MRLESDNEAIPLIVFPQLGIQSERSQGWVGDKIDLNTEAEFHRTSFCAGPGESLVSSCVRAEGNPLHN